MRQNNLVGRIFVGSDGGRPAVNFRLNQLRDHSIVEHTQFSGLFDQFSW